MTAILTAKLFIFLYAHTPEKKLRSPSARHHSAADALAVVQHRATLLARRGKQAINYPHSVAAAWSLSSEKIEQAYPAAAELLHLCAYLAPNHIPEGLLINGAAYWPAVL